MPATRGKRLSAGPVVFVSNTPSPYQIDLFTAIARKAPVAAYFHADGQAAQNVSWKLDYPEWLHILPQVGGWAKAAFIRRRHQAAKPSLIILGGFQSPGHIALMVWARLRGVPLWVWMEAPEPHLYDKGLKLLVKRVAREVLSRAVLPLATGILAIDGRAERAYRRFHKRVERQPYAIDAAPFKARKTGNVKGPLKCLFIGQLIERKGIDALLEAFKGISVEDAMLSLAGGGPMKAEVEAFCLQTGHQYLGFVQPAELPAVLAGQDVFVFPSRYDGWAVVVPQAMAAGLPVMSNPAVGAFADLVMPNGVAAGTLCDVQADALRKAVMRYVHERALVDAQGEAARAIFLNSRAEVTHAAAHILSLAS